VVLLFAVLAVATPTRAAFLVVNSPADDDGSSSANCLSGSGNCTLRGAIAAGQNGDTIGFAVTGTIPLTASNGSLTIDKNVTIQGSGDDILAVSGQNAIGVFIVQASVQATISGLTIENGNRPGDVVTAVGSGIKNAGTLTVSRVTFSANQAASSLNGGGAISNGGTLTVIESTFNGNSTAGNGGAINNTATLTVTDSTFSGNGAGGGGAIFSGLDSSTSVTGSSFVSNSSAVGGGMWMTGGTTRVTNSTFINNSATQPNADGGGAINARNGPTSLTVVNSTFSGNSAGGDGGGGFLSLGATTAFINSTFSGNSDSAISRVSGIVRLRNTIVAHNTWGNCSGTLGASGISSQGNNVSDDATCFSVATNGDQPNTDPKLGALVVNSPGNTASFALLPNSPAIDAVTAVPSDCPGAPAANPDRRPV
jgi:hypothetical protein